MKQSGIKVMAIQVGIDNTRNLYRAIFTYPGGRIFRRLDFEPSNGAWVEKGLVIHGEPPHKVANIWQACGIIANQLRDTGAFSSKGRMAFLQAMDDYLDWHEKYRHNPKIRSQAKAAIDSFGGCRLNAISREDVRRWIDELSGEYADKTVRNVVAVPLQMYNWLARECRYDGHNPFAGHEWKAAGETRAIKPTVQPEDFHRLVNSAKNRQLVQAAYIGYYTGVRPSEVYRVRPEDFDHENLILKVKVEKTRGKPFTRLVAIPRTLSIWVVNNGFVEMNESTVINNFVKAAKSDTLLTGLCMESFRKSFAGLMESLGASHEAIDAHQGRTQNSVITKHYLRDKMRAVKLMRPFIAKAFDGENEQVLRLLK